MNDSNKYIKPLTNEEIRYWEESSGWFRREYQKQWFDRIDTKALAEDVGEHGDNIVDLVISLINYIRMRERVIRHRESVTHHTTRLIDTALRQPSSKEEMRTKLIFITRYLEQMQAASALDPLAPNIPTPPTEEQ